MLRFFCCISVVFFSFGLLGQNINRIVPGVVVNGDTLALMQSREIVIAAKLPFSDPEAAKRYYHLVRDIRKVYPYAILISIRVKEFNKEMEKMSSREKREFIKKKEPILREEFERFFRSNTVNQAQLLIKLVDRETGDNSFHLIKELKGTWNAMVWQSFARIVGTNLKSDYDPNGDDKEIEKIVRLIEAEEK